MLQKLRRRFMQSKTADQIQEYVTSPGEIPYREQGTVITKVPAEKCRTNFLGFPISHSPFVLTLTCNASEYSGSPLAAFYSAFQPVTVGELLGLKDSSIASQPAMAAVMPWWHRTPAQRLAQVAVTREDGSLLGKEAIKLGADAGSDFGWQYFGPVSSGVGMLEFRRQKAVFDNIRDTGFRPTSATQLHGEFLLSGDDWVWVNVGGKHRVNALIALGTPVLKVSAKGKYGPVFVRRSESALWPNVQNGLFTEQEALALFDRIMAGNGPVEVNL